MQYSAMPMPASYHTSLQLSSEKWEMRFMTPFTGSSLLQKGLDWLWIPDYPVSGWLSFLEKKVKVKRISGNKGITQEHNNGETGRVNYQGSTILSLLHFSWLEKYIVNPCFLQLPFRLLLAPTSTLGPINTHCQRNYPFDLLQILGVEAI